MADFRVFTFDNQKFLVNIDNITQIFANGDNECKIWFITEEDSLRVDGTLDEVYSIILRNKV